MKQLWKKNLIDIAPYVPGEQSEETGIVKLNANENPYPPSPKATAVLRAFDTETLRLYPDANGSALKQAIADFYGVEKDNVFLGNGSDDVIALAFRTFFNGELPIVFPDITYSFYPVWCSFFKIPYETLKLDETFRIHPADYAAPNGGVVIPNPNAPTGIGEGERFVREILENNPDSVVIIDEAYADFSGYSCTGLTSRFDNLLVTGTFSKSRSLAGLRIGFAIGNTALISALESVKNSFNSYTMDSIAMAAGKASMEDTEYFEKTVNRVCATRERVADALRDLGFLVPPSGTNFLFVTHPKAAAKPLFAYLRSKKVFVRYFDQPRIDNHLRISVGTDAEMDTFLAAVKAFFSENF